MCVSGCLNKWWRNAWRSTRIISSLASPFINRGLIYQNSSPTTHQYVRLWGPSWARYPSAIQSGLLGQQLELTGLAWPSGIIWVSEIILPLQRRKYNRGHNWKFDKARAENTQRKLLLWHKRWSFLAGFIVFGILHLEQLWIEVLGSLLGLCGLDQCSEYQTKTYML